MGYIKHDAIVITSAWPLHLKEAREKALELRLPCSSIVKAPVNGYGSFLVAPDGSKEGWEDSRNGDEARAELIEWMRENRSSLDWAHISYGGDEKSKARLVDHNNDEPWEEETIADPPPGASACPVCPVCGSFSDPRPLKVHNGILGPGDISVVVGYECPGCSVWFKDPSRFYRQSVVAAYKALPAPEVTADQLERYLHRRRLETGREINLAMSTGTDPQYAAAFARKAEVEAMIEALERLKTTQTPEHDGKQD